ncbi:MAG: hypothetical protein ACYCOR_21010 [Acidobacteriaceae bacterium]
MGSVLHGVVLDKPLQIAAELPSGTPIIDSHIHLFDTQRSGGVPWPKLLRDAVIHKPALPDRYSKIARPSGVVGAIAVEASPLASDNDWVLCVAAGNSMIVGVVGNLYREYPPT